MNDTRNLILAVGLSMGILLGWHFFYERPLEIARQQELARQAPAPVAANPNAPKPLVSPVLLSADAAREQGPRIKINAPALHGSISLKGARLDDLTLAGYKATTDKNAPEVVLFSPSGTEQVYFAEFGWLAPNQPGVQLPGANTLWRADHALLTTAQPVTLSWDNPQGLKFSMKISLDEHYLFTIERRVENASGQPVTLSPYGLLSRARPEAKHFYILQEGPIAVMDHTLHEVPFHKLKEEKTAPFEGHGWLGITDKYWLAAMIPAQDQALTGNATYYQDNGDRYQLDYTGTPFTLAPGAAQNDVTHLFAGAKKVALLDGYEDRLGIQLFDRAIDFGWFYFLTKPMFYALNWFYSHIGNFGLALMALTVAIKLLMFPLANKSYRAMSRMKHFQPKIVELRAKYGDDKVKLNQEVMEFYKKEKINPVSGCLPMLIQIPVFFALYKVLFVTIEMRQAPFYGWIHDLSAPDPTTLFNLFGLLPFNPPVFLHVGAWSIIMGITMIIQQRLNPPPADPVQAKVIQLMPYFFVFIFTSFPAGLVIYWSWSNFISILQQLMIAKVLDKEVREKRKAHKKAKKS